ncbi:hypothetical protein [Maridesulfovibrio ferrireducens]|uniref:hypothetical protein n=1 Tax=Maridesulfovibrio ferrireducens TaxID=246191 RepID=UPI001A3399F2|nr:hypothetical protein [Maridesulfovibrio ferrireducens]MBI9113137.1 hypothetical protein [Maridesulfovibrio ferrireducens]
MAQKTKAELEAEAEAKVKEELELKAKEELKAEAKAEAKAEFEAEAKIKAEAEAKAKEEEPEPEPEVEKLHKIIIPSSAEFDGKKDVFLNANGRRFQIQRDVEVEVPKIVINVLKDAVKTEQVTDEAGRIVGTRNVQRYPFQTL